ncbi:MAG: non-canonical purine NTP pyrophosphatase [Gemmatimonadales bacterium]|nr:MAG: non-canonical purine NTP pyrophosphatase [Gemmatimonadales bacterium]
MKLLVATRSAGKQREVKRLLEDSGLDLVFPEDMNLFEDPAEDLLETSDSFRANALAKAEHFAKRSHLPTVADDSGLEVFYLGAAPGTRSKRWAGATGTAEEVDAANNAELVRRLAGAPALKRMARYRCALVLIRTVGAMPEVFEAECAGRILEAPAGTAGFGYDPYFFSTDLGMSFGEATDAEKDAVSHRGKAFKALVTALKE